MELLPFVAVLAIMYLLVMRPQQKRQREQVSMLSNLAEGDDVITIGGIYGTIVGLTDEVVDLQVDAAGQVLRFRRGAVASIPSSAVAHDDDEPDDDADVDVHDEDGDEVEDGTDVRGTLGPDVAHE